MSVENEQDSQEGKPTENFFAIVKNSSGISFSVIQPISQEQQKLICI